MTLLVRIHYLTGEPEKALDRLEPLIRIPYRLSAGWLRIDPTFDPPRLAGPGALSSPANARRAVAAVSDILTKAQALGQTELASDPAFRSALGQVSTRFGAGLGLGRGGSRAGQAGGEPCYWQRGPRAAAAAGARSPDDRGGRRAETAFVSFPASSFLPPGLRRTIV
jgi:hypothetical protein